MFINHLPPERPVPREGDLICAPGDYLIWRGGGAALYEVLAVSDTTVTVYCVVPDRDEKSEGQLKKELQTSYKWLHRISGLEAAALMVKHGIWEGE